MSSKRRGLNSRFDRLSDRAQEQFLTPSSRPAGRTKFIKRNSKRSAPVSVSPDHAPAAASSTPSFQPSKRPKLTHLTSVPSAIGPAFHLLRDSVPSSSQSAAASTSAATSENGHVLSTPLSIQRTVSPSGRRRSQIVRQSATLDQASSSPSLFHFGSARPNVPDWLKTALQQQHQQAMNQDSISSIGSGTTSSARYSSPLVRRVPSYPPGLARSANSVPTGWQSYPMEREQTVPVDEPSPFKYNAPHVPVSPLEYLNDNRAGSTPGPGFAHRLSPLPELSEQPDLLDRIGDDDVVSSIAAYLEDNGEPRQMDDMDMDEIDMLTASSSTLLNDDQGFEFFKDYELNYGTEDEDPVEMVGRL